MQEKLNDMILACDDPKMDREQKRLDALFRVSHTLGNSLDVDEVLTQVMDAVIHLVQAERGFLVLLENDRDSWELRAARNYDQRTLLPKDMEISGTVVNKVLKSGKGVLTTDALSDPRFHHSEFCDSLCAALNIVRTAARAWPADWGDFRR